MHVDTLIYINNMFDTMRDSGFFKEFSQENGLDEKQFEQELREYVEAEAQGNYESEKQDPTLTEEQMLTCIKFAATTCLLSSLMDKGLIKAEFDTSQGDIAYSLTEEGKKLTVQ